MMVWLALNGIVCAERRCLCMVTIRFYINNVMPSLVTHMKISFTYWHHIHVMLPQHIINLNFIKWFPIQFRFPTSTFWSKCLVTIRARNNSNRCQLTSLFTVLLFIRFESNVFRSQSYKYTCRNRIVNLFRSSH